MGDLPHRRGSTVPLCGAGLVDNSCRQILLLAFVHRDLSLNGICTRRQLSVYLSILYLFVYLFVYPMSAYVLRDTCMRKYAMGTHEPEHRHSNKTDSPWNCMTS